MYRVGICTGKVYSDKIHTKDIHECCICADPAYPKDEGIEHAKERAHLRRVMYACGKECFDCEESQKEQASI